jgi:hypothetical protein
LPPIKTGEKPKRNRPFPQRTGLTREIARLPHLAQCLTENRFPLFLTLLYCPEIGQTEQQEAKPI